MIYRRAVAKLRAQDWMAISIELAIVIIGVFVGNWVNDWSRDRAERREAAALVVKLRPQLERLSALQNGENAYYRTTRRFAEVALAGWTGNPQVSDRDFVIAAYQASQVAGITIDSASLSTALGADAVRKIDDVQLRDAIISVMSFNFTALQANALQDDYRKQVREVIPDPMQQAIRKSCGDRLGQDYLVLPPTCDIDFPAGQAARTAALLRSHPELPGELNFHLAQTDSWFSNLSRLEIRVRSLLALIDGRSGPQ
jgi:hypothetical protein